MGSRRAREQVGAHERSLPGELRSELGAHYTPEPLAERLVDLGFARLGQVTEGALPTVCDPSCGAGSVLLAAADRLLALGAAPSEVLAEHLLGCDIDPGAVRAARSALRQWARDAGEPHPPPARILCHDALDLPAGLPPVGLVVGNPPFASPLRSSVAQRLSRSRPGGAYADDASVHLEAAVRMAAPGGVVCLLQPQSVLGSRDASAIREEIEHWATLEELWATDADLFADASVRVCVPVLVRRAANGQTLAGEGGRGAGSPAGRTVAVRFNDDPALEIERRPGDSWAVLLAAGMGTPAAKVPGHASRGRALVRIGDVARCTAGFREEFYALGEAAFEPAGEGVAGLRAVTVGMIDPGALRWGGGSFRLAGRAFTAPRVDPARLAHISPRVSRWAASRSVPKVLVASQTKVLEAVVDPDGDLVGVTPVVSVEPTGGCPPAALGAMLSAPSNSARLATLCAGTGRNPSVLRVSARSVAELTASRDPSAWSAAADLWSRFESFARRRVDAARWRDLGRDLDALIGAARDEGVVSWWVDRLPRRIVDRST